MTACGTGEQWQRALGFLCMIDALRLRKTIVSFNAALRACGKCAKWQHALHIFRSVGDSQLQGDSVSYRTIINACSQEWNQALLLLQEGRETILATDVSSYGAVISACQAASCWKEALSVFESLAEAGVEADARSFTSAITSSIRGEDWQGAVARFSDMLKQSLETDSIVQNAGLRARGWLLWQSAIQQLALLVQAGLRPDVASYNTVLSACEGQWRRSLALATQMEHKAMKSTVVTMGVLLSGKNELSETWSRPLQLLAAWYLRSAETSVVSHTNLLAGMADSWHNAVAYFAALQARGVIKVLPMETAAAHAFRNGGRWQQVVNVAAQATGVADLVMRHVVLDSQVSALQWRSGVQVYASLALRNLQPNLLTANLALSACQWRLASALLRNLGLSALETNVVSCSTAIAACGTSSRWQFVSMLLERLEERRLETNTIACNSAVSALGKSMHWQLASWVLSDARVLGDEIGYDALVLACSQAENSLQCGKGRELQLFARLLRHLAKHSCSDVLRKFFLPGRISTSRKGLVLQHRGS